MRIASYARCKIQRERAIFSVSLSLVRARQLGLKETKHICSFVRLVGTLSGRSISHDRHRAVSRRSRGDGNGQAGKRRMRCQSSGFWQADSISLHRLTASRRLPGRRCGRGNHDHGGQSCRNTHRSRHESSRAYSAG